MSDSLSAQAQPPTAMTMGDTGPTMEPPEVIKTPTIKIGKKTKKPSHKRAHKKAAKKTMKRRGKR